MSKKILITGGLGNLGSWVTEHFVKLGYDVTVLSNNKREILQNIDFEFIACDISKINECKEKLEGKKFDVVFHLASVNDGFVKNYPFIAIMINALGTRNILEALNGNVKHFVYFSTFQVYGKYQGNITEETPLETKNDYGLTHLFAEQYVKQFHLNNKLPYTILRLTNSYGCPKDADTSKWYLVLNDLSKMAFENEEIVLKSNGKVPRDFIWMGDVVKILEKLALLKPTNDTFNLSGETTFQMLEIAQAVQTAFYERFAKKLEIKVNQDDKSEFKEGFSVSSQKLKKIIPYSHNNQMVEEAKKIFSLLTSKID